MSEIIIDQTDLNITVTPNTTQLNVFTGGYACAQGNTNEFQFNNGGVLAGANGLTYNSGSQTTTAANLTVTNNTDLGAIGNITITGGNAGDVLTTDGSGGLSFSEIANANFAAFAGNVIEAAQPNITSVGNLTNLTVTGNATASYFIGNGSQLTGLAEGDEISNGTSNVRVLSANGAVAIGVNGNANILVANATGITVNRANLGSVANLNIGGGNNGFVLQTDGTGNLTWTAMTGNAGNGVVGGSNTQVQYNDGGVFGGSAGFTFNKASNLLSAPGGITAVGNVTGNYILGDAGFLSNVPGSTSISNGNSNVRVVGSGGNISTSVAGNADILVVTGTGANLSGYANITGNISAANASFTSVSGNGSGLSSITGANVTGTVANATYAVSAGSANTAGTVTTAAQPNITSVGTLTGLGVNGNITAANITANTGVFTGNGSGLTNITATNINLTNTQSNNDFYVVFASSSGNQPLYVDTSSPSQTLIFNPNIGRLRTSEGVFDKMTNMSGEEIEFYNDGIRFNVTGQSNIVNFSNTVVNVQGNISAGNINGGNLVTGNYISGSLITSAQPNITSLGNLTSLNVLGTSTVQQIKEKININANTPGGNINFDILSSATLYYPNAANSNITLNFRGNSTTTFSSVISNSQSITASFIMVNSSSDYYLTSNIQIDGSNISTYWISPGPGTLFSGLANSTVVYNFNIISDSSSNYIALASIVGFV